MGQMERDDFIIGPDDPILVTGTTGFIGSRLVASLLDRGFRNLLCFARPSGEVARLAAIASRHEWARIEVLKGILSSGETPIALQRSNRRRSSPSMGRSSGSRTSS